MRKLIGLILMVLVFASCLLQEDNSHSSQEPNPNYNDLEIKPGMSWTYRINRTNDHPLLDFDSLLIFVHSIYMKDTVINDTSFALFNEKIFSPYDQDSMEVFTKSYLGYLGNKILILSGRGGGVLPL